MALSMLSRTQMIHRARSSSTNLSGHETTYSGSIDLNFCFTSSTSSSSRYQSMGKKRNSKETMKNRYFKMGGMSTHSYWCKSNSISAPYVNLQTRNGWKKVETCQFGSAKWFWPSNFCIVCWGQYKAQQSLTPAREECNKYDLTAAPCF